MKKTDSVHILAFPVLLGLIVTLLLMLMGAALVYSGRCDENAISALTLLFLACGSFPAGLMASQRAAESKLMWGAITGLMVFFCLALLSLTWFNEPVSWLGMAKNGGVCVTSAMLGGAAAGRIRSKHKKHRKR